MNYINNKWLEGHGFKFNSYNPADQKILWTGKSSVKKDVDAAVNAARAAFKDWGHLTLDERAVYVKKFVDKLLEHTKKLAQVFNQENGKPIWAAEYEVQELMAARYKISLDAYKVRTGEQNTKGQPSSRLKHFPNGVMIVFGPFNFPGGLPLGHIIPALLAGNTVVYKPTELHPLIAEAIIKCWDEANLPEGVINLLQGARETGELLVNHPDIDGVLFTGSYEVGKAIHKNLAGRLNVVLALELGGNNPLIIDDEIEDLDAAVYNTIVSVFFNSGQVCGAAKRLFVPNNTFGKKFISKLVQSTSKISVSDGINQINMDHKKDKFEYFMGPVVNLQAAEKILKIRQNLINKFNVDELLELKQVSPTSALLTPGIILNTDKSYIDLDNDVECFGPLLHIFQYDTFDEAIKRANGTKFGLSSGIFTDNQEKYNLFFKQIHAGVVNWNIPIIYGDLALPFGGVGLSGNHHPSNYYTADGCAYPVISMYETKLKLPEIFLPGIQV